MRWHAVIFISVLVLLAGAYGPARPFGVLASQHAQSAAARKVCHTVTKKVHGKKKKVKVCKTVTPKPTPISTPLPPDQEATQLVSTLTAATDETSRYAALLQTMKALGIGVYDGTGKAVVSGTDAFYLYEVEVAMVAGAMGTPPSESVDDIAGRLAGIGVEMGGQPIDGEGLRKALIAAVQAAVANPASPTSLAPLLLRDLGLQHSPAYDLAQDVPADHLTIDPLQGFLLTVGAVVPLIEAAPGGTVTRKLVSGQTTCGSMDASGRASMITFMTGASVSGNPTRSQLIEWLHAMNWHYGWDPLPQTSFDQSTHYGPAGHAPDAGKPLHYAAAIGYRLGDVEARYGEDIIACGTLAGVTFPTPGHLGGIPTDWRWSYGSSSLDQHGTVTSDSQTDANGITNMYFTPKDEVVPGFGQEKTNTGSVGYQFHLIYAFKRLPADIISKDAKTAFGSYSSGTHTDQAAANGIFATRINWRVTRHAPRGFMFDGEELKYHACNAGGCVNEDITYSGHVCGENPYAQPWTFTFVATETITGAEARVTTEPPTSFPAPLQPNTSWELPGDPVDHRQWQFIPGTSGNPTMRLTWSPTSPFTPDTSVDQSVPVTEDTTDCPPPKP